MKYSVLSISPFDKQLKRLVKKYPSLRVEMLVLIDNLENHPNIGTPLGKDCYKIRIAIRSKGKGKSGGARVITYFQITANAVYLIAIYDKSELSTLSDKDLQILLDIIQ